MPGGPCTNGADDVAESSLILDLVLALVVAFAGGMIARRIGLPVLLGYIVAGILIGPHTPGPIAASDRVDLLANLGVGFLMFALGVEFSLGDLLRVRRIALIAGGIQIPATILVGFLAGEAFGWSWRASLVLGGAFAISSSIVALKLLLGRGEGNSPQARIALGIGVIQDLSLVPMVAVVHALAGEEEQLAGDIGLALLKGFVAILAVIIVGTKIVPRVFDVVARTQSRELFILTVVMIAFGAAYAGEQAGLSLALGAFLAGLIVSESEYDSQVLADIIPFRDHFSIIFFVSIGMLVDPVFLWDHVWILLAGIAVLIISKLLIFGAILLALHINHVTATITAILLAQMAEFSFILANEGRRERIISDEQYSLILAMALGSIMLVPLLLQLAPALTSVAQRLPAVLRRETAMVGGRERAQPLRDHVIVCGYGRVGRELGESLQQTGIPFATIDLNAPRIRHLRGEGVLALFGDASQQTLLERAHIRQARVLAITYLDFVMAQAAMEIARQLNPDIRIIARATAAGEIGSLDAHGAEEIVQPEFEAGMEFVRQTLIWCDPPLDVTMNLVEERRAAYYRIPGSSLLPPERATEAV
jgi:CPA2 family monovalent cation:H+ antiporter-2